MAVSKRLRYEILRRDNYTCRYCGQAAPDVPLSVDHVTPVALGGSDDPSNLVAACADCNSGKSSTSPDAPIVADVAQDALRWAAATEQAAAERFAAAEFQRSLRDAFDDRWHCFTWTDFRGDHHAFGLPDDFAVSIAQFFSAGLTYNDLEELVDVAMASHARDKWQYFCGCCWRRVRQAQERAVQIMKEADSGA